MLVALLALFIAMGGSAVAAHHYLLSSTKQISPTVLKKLKGRAGPAGPKGLIGLTGPAGSAGSAGAAGKNGANLTARDDAPVRAVRVRRLLGRRGWDAGKGGEEKKTSAT